MTKLDRTTGCFEIDEQDIYDGGISDEMLAELGLTDVTYSRPEFLHDCEINNGYTLGYYEASDGTIFRLDLLGRNLELNKVSTDELGILIHNYEQSK